MNSSSASQNGTTSNFYIGRFGEGSSPSTFFSNPNPCPANNFTQYLEPGSNPSIVNPQLQFGQWWLQGPDQLNDPITGLTQAYNLGWNEGAASFECWYGLLWNRYPAGLQDSGFGGLNIFADVEINNSSDPTDWWIPGQNTSLPPSQAYSLNTQTLMGFLDAVKTFTNVAPGVYISASTLNEIMPGLNLESGCNLTQCPDPNLPATLWQAGGCNQVNVPVTNAPPDPSTVENYLDTIESNTSTASQDPSNPNIYTYSAGPCAIANLSAAIWQYTVSNQNAGYPNDFDIVDPNQMLQAQGSVPAQNECIQEQIFFSPIVSCGEFFTSTPVPIGTS